ncbi:selenoprotein j [Plakobranchus ocellatus]|uniref:Selenoprotein j n=1 Tax=Plakobranchus ocellatus TaxID=259542 RepID=A0AAV4BQ46_9GAST|nr:selenoprotein j [Plakobranchus ocellatus]
MYFSDLPTSLQSSLHGLVTASSYVEGIRSTIRVGGCNASRSGFIGACMAAKEGFDTVPESWRSRTHRYEEVLELALQLVKIKP